MLGDIIYETKVGKLIGTRLISVEEGIPKSRLLYLKKVH